MQIALIAVAGAVGAVMRYGVSRAVQPSDADFPFGTLAVNLSGSLLLGLLGALLIERFEVSSELRTALLVGLIGSYTTFSTLSVETLQLMERGEWMFAALNIGVSIAGGLGAAWAGQTLARA